MVRVHLASNAGGSSVGRALTPYSHDPCKAFLQKETPLTLCPCGVVIGGGVKAPSVGSAGVAKR